MSHKRTKKDVEEAYRRGFEAGFNVRPNPLAMTLRSIWRKHELKMLKRAWKETVRKNGGVHPVWDPNHTAPVELVIQENWNAR